MDTRLRETILALTQQRNIAHDTIADQAGEIAVLLEQVNKLNQLVADLQGIIDDGQRCNTDDSGGSGHKSG